MAYFLAAFAITVILGLVLLPGLVKPSPKVNAEFYDMRPIANAYCFVQAARLECLSINKEGN